jgi:hypothetical protein
MGNTPRRLFGLLLGISVVAGGGCSGPAWSPEGPAKGLVSGGVKVKGRPVVAGEVTFAPTGGAAAGTEPLTAAITNGNYETGLISGQYRVTVRASRGGKAATPVGVPKRLDVGGGLVAFDIAL